MKLSEPIPQVTFWNPRARGKSKGMGYLGLEFQGHGGVSRGDRQECESTNKMTNTVDYRGK